MEQLISSRLPEWAKDYGSGSGYGSGYGDGDGR